MSEKVVKVTLLDPKENKIYTYDGNLSLITTVKDEDKKKATILLGMGSAFIVPGGSTFNEEEAAKNAAIRILQEKFKPIVVTGFNLFGFGMFPTNLQVRKDEMKICEKEYSDQIPIEPNSPVPVLFCYKLNDNEKKSITASSGSPFVGFPVIGIPPYILSSDPYTAAFLARRYEPLYPTMRSLPIFSNYANRLETNYVPALGFESRSYSPYREKESRRSGSTNSRPRSTSPRSRRHREKYLKYKQKYLSLKNNL
jgi:hypothetical protein